MTDDTSLLRRAQSYDAAALAELYDRYALRMYAYIYRRVGDSALAEDLTSELFLRVLRAIRNERAWRDSFTAWIYRIAHNLVVDQHRRRLTTPDLPLDEELLSSDEEGPDRAVESAADCEHLRRAIARLTPEQQEVLALRFGEGLTAREIAEIVRKTTGAVEALQHRALASLRRILTGETDR